MSHNPGGDVAQDGCTKSKLSRNNLTLNFAQLGESDTKKRKIESFLLETPAELAKLFTDTNSATKYMFSPLQTPDIAKIGISTPELDRIALRSRFIPSGTLPTPMTLANILDPNGSGILGGLENNNSTGGGQRTEIKQEYNNNQVTLIHPPFFSTSNGDAQTNADDNQYSGRKRSRDAIIDDQHLQLATSLMMLSSHSEHSVSSNDSKEHLQMPSHLSQTSRILPIDMNNQELIKKDRKRERNRIAASRCRQRKLERITVLQEKCNLFEDKNNKLRQYIEFLEELIQRRENAFCTHERFIHKGEFM